MVSPPILNRAGIWATHSDMALFERVEVVRGATGLMTGTGNPSAAINMVRKHATSREFKGDVSAEYGSWNKNGMWRIYKATHRRR